MSERLPEWQPMGMDLPDLVDIQDVIEEPKSPEQEKLEHKKAEYEAIAMMLAQSVEPLKEIVKEDLGGSLLREPVIKSVLAKAVGQIEDSLSDEEALEIMNHATQVTNGSNYVGDKPKVSLHNTIDLGMNTGSQVMAAYWQTIIGRYGIDKLHEVGTHPRTLGTLAAIVRAWTLPELSSKLQSIGGTRPDYGQPAYLEVIPASLFAFKEDSVQVGPELKKKLGTEYSGEHVGCPVGHKVGLPEHDAETVTVMPIKEYAKIILDAWSDKRQKVIDTL